MSAGTSAATESPEARRVEESAKPTRPMREDDLLRFVWIADPQISPDGSRIAFTRVWVDAEADEYRSQIWIADSAGGPPRPLTAGVGDSQARWSPDGRRLAFVRSPGSGKPGQLHLLPMAGGEAVALTDLEKGASDPAWSPDGSYLAFLSSHNPDLDGPGRKKPKNEPAMVVTKPVFRDNDQGFLDDAHRDHVWVIEAQPGAAPRPLTRGPYGASMVRWSRDGRRILFVSDRRAEPWFGPECSKLWEVSPELERATEGEEIRLVVDSPGAIVAWTEGPGGEIALIGSVPAEPACTYDQPGVFVARGPGSKRELVRLGAGYDFPFGESIASDQHPPRGGGECPLAFDADGAVITRVGKQGSSLLVRVAGDSVTELTAPGQEIVSGTTAAAGSRWALVIANTRTPGDLWLLDTARAEGRCLYEPNREWLSGIALGELEELWFPSFDGRPIHAWLLKPPGYEPSRPHPLVLEIHGGPHTAYGHGFFHEFHVLAGAGYLVLFTNPRGSTTYGEEFARTIQYRFPDEDAQDLLRAVDHALERGGVDPARLGVTGGSGGGLLTNWIVTRTDRFAAAVTQRCVADWAGMYYSSDFALFTPFWFRKPPFEDPEEYRERSPAAFAARIETPLMVIHSEADWRTPIAQGETMFRALLQQRKRAVMVRFPGESHELSRSGVPSRRVQNQEHIRRWFDRWLLGKPAPEYGF